MDWLISFLNTLNNLTPLAVIALLGVIIFLLVRGKESAATREQVTTLKENDLHHLPEMIETLRRIEFSLTDNFSWIRAKLNGGHN